MGAKPGAKPGARPGGRMGATLGARLGARPGRGLGARPVLPAVIVYIIHTGTLPVVGRTRHMYVNIYPSSIFDCVYIIPTESVKELSLTDSKTDLWVTAREAGLEPGRVGGWGKGRRPGWGPSRGPGRVRGWGPHWGPGRVEGWGPGRSCLQ